MGPSTPGMALNKFIELSFGFFIYKLGRKGPTSRGR